MTSEHTLSDDAVERLQASYEAVTTLPNFEYSNTAQGLADFAAKMLAKQDKNGRTIMISTFPELDNFIAKLNTVKDSFSEGMRANTPLQKQKVSKTFIAALRNAIGLTNPAVTGTHELTSPSADRSFVAQLDARSRESGPRQGSDDPAHPEKSVNTFMNEVRGALEYAGDIFERLEYALTSPGGEKHKFFGTTTGKAALRFDSLRDAQNAMDTLGKLIGEDSKAAFNELLEVAISDEIKAEFHERIGHDAISMFDALMDKKNQETLYALVDEGTRTDLDEVIRNAMTIESEVIKHKTYFWLKVPSKKATNISQVVASLTAMRSHVENLFHEGVEASDMTQAEQERAALLVRIEGMGLGDTHLAEQMARDVLRGSQKEIVR